MKHLYSLYILFVVTLFANLAYAVTYNELLEEIGHISNDRKTLEEVSFENKKVADTTNWFKKSKIYLSFGVNTTPNLTVTTPNLVDSVDSKDILSNNIIGGHLAFGFSPFDKKYLRSFRTELLYDKSWVNQNNPTDTSSLTGEYQSINLGIIEYYDIFLTNYFYLSFGFGAHKSKNDFLSTDASNNIHYNTTTLSNHIQLSFLNGFVYTEYARYYDKTNKTNKTNTENRIDIGLRVPIN